MSARQQQSRIARHSSASALSKTSTVVVDARVGITPSSVRRAARRAGVREINTDVYEHVMKLYDAFVGTLVHEMCVNARHARHEEVALEDARAALRDRDIVVYA